MCTKRCRCSVSERLCQHPQQINSRPLCAGGLEKQSDSERAANEFERADLKVSAARMSDNAAFGHKKPQQRHHKDHCASTARTSLRASSSYSCTRRCVSKKRRMMSAHLSSPGLARCCLGCRAMAQSPTSEIDFNLTGQSKSSSVHSFSCHAGP